MEYERIGPLVLFGEPVPERADGTGTPERALYHRIAAFRDGGMGSLYDASLSRGAKLEAVTNPRLFADRYGTAQLTLFESQYLLGDAGWPKALRLEGYAVRPRLRPEALQQALFPYLAAL